MTILYRLKLHHEWERETGIKAKTILKRIDCLGWPVEDALSKPTREVKKR